MVKNKVSCLEEEEEEEKAMMLEFVGDPAPRSCQRGSLRNSRNSWQSWRSILAAFVTNTLTIEEYVHWRKFILSLRTVSV